MEEDRRLSIKILQHIKERTDMSYFFESIKELDSAVSYFAYKWYNPINPHSYNGYMTPFEKRYSI